MSFFPVLANAHSLVPVPIALQPESLFAKLARICTHTKVVADVVLHIAKFGEDFHAGQAPQLLVYTSSVWVPDFDYLPLFFFSFGNLTA